MYSSMVKKPSVRTIKGDAVFKAEYIDFRSDTVTRPCAGMRAVMAKARVGDDVYEDDPTVQKLEYELALISGKETALFFPTGTQSNLAALLSFCGRGDEYIVGDQYHIYRDEAGGAAVLGGISPFPIATDKHGCFNPDQLRAAVKPDDIHCPESKLLCLENTVSGQIQSQENIIALCRVAKDNNLRVHLDGARIFNAMVGSCLSLKELCDPVDSVSICLSKGLGAPVGSVLCGDNALIRRAKRMRKLLGGGMRQVGVLAACGLYALDHNISALKQDHARAAKLAEDLADIPQIEVNFAKSATNMVFVNPGEGHHTPLANHLLDNGILIGGQQPEIRIVTHLNIDDYAVDFLVDKIKVYYASI